ncbi:MAG: hypothetical protein P4N41_06745 [Negativicutes bacterium]|nr:hypothetical protein [Negativicutes bacterium]
MNWDMAVILWPTIYLLLAVAAVFFLWAMRRRKKKPRSDSWKEIMAVAVFCLVGSLLMIFVNSIDLQLSFLARLGAVTAILCLYAYYSYKRNKK